MASFVKALALFLLWLALVATSAVDGARRRPCRIPHRKKTVDVGGYLGWALGLYGVWQQPAVYVGDRLRFTWPSPPGGSEGGDDARERSLAGRALAGKAGTLLEHNVYAMPTKNAFDRCQFSDRFALSETNYTTVPLKSPGTYYYGCEEDQHCRAGQKVAIVVKKAPLYDTCPQPPPPPAQNGVVYVGTAPNFWTIDMTKWRQPVVRTGDKLVCIVCVQCLSGTGTLLPLHMT